MKSSSTQSPDAISTQKRRPRVAVLGEFSAGKSTLINLMTGGRQLRTQVTATQMPAVWMSHGTGAPFAVDLDGNEREIDLADPKSVSVEDVAYIRAFMKTPILTLCDLIDTPGNSDPNIGPIAWERIAEIADIAVWCSPSTQAWRQSELAAWKEVPERVREKSILLLTRADKLLTEEDRLKVLRRVTHEASGLFRKIHMGSLLRFADVQEAVRDLVDLCREVEASDMPGATDTAMVLTGMFRSQSEQPTAQSPETSFDAEQAAIEDALDMTAAQADTSVMSSDPRPKPRADESGFATALWQKLTHNLDADDPAALETAFRQFLTTIDAEIASLRNVSDIKIAS